MKRTKLKKYLGKKLRYTGKIIKLNDDNLLMIDVKLDGKKVCDHIWTSNTAAAGAILGEGMEVSFMGTATAYNRADGSRDYKIGKIHSFKDVTVLNVQYDNNQKYKRINR